MPSAKDLNIAFSCEAEAAARITSEPKGNWSAKSLFAMFSQLCVSSGRTSSNASADARALPNYDRPLSASGIHAVVYLNHILGKGLTLVGEDNALGFLFFYELLIGALNIKILSADIMLPWALVSECGSQRSRAAPRLWVVSVERILMLRAPMRSS